MKKLLRKRSLFLVALLVGLCMPMMAQTDVQGNALSESEYYFVRNVSTGLYLRYGGEWGSFASEGRAGHPVMIKKNGNYYSINSLKGALNSGNGAAELFFDREQGESKWQFVKYENTNSYILVGNNGGALASRGNKPGNLAMVSYNEYDNRVRWEFLTEAQVRNLVNSANATNPIDITPLIKASSFDLFDGEEMMDPLKTEFGSTDSQTSNGKTTYHYTYVGHWKKYMERRFYNWHTMVRGTTAEIYNSIGISQNNTNTWEIYQDITLPAGNYYFSFEGFYRNQQQRIVQKQTCKKSSWGEWFDSWDDSGEPVRQPVTDATMTATVKLQYKRNSSFTDIKSFALAQNTTINVPDVDTEDYKCLQDVTGATILVCADPEVGPAAAALLRDGDDYKQGYAFSLNSETTLRILISKGSTTKSAETTENEISRTSRDIVTTVYKNWVCFDNFTLVSFGKNSATEDLSKLYYQKLKDYIDEVRAKVESLGFNDDAKELFEEDIQQIALDATNQKATIVLTDDFGNETSRVVNTEELYLEALAIIEEAFNSAYDYHLECLKKDNMDLSDYMIFNRGFENGNTFGWSGGTAVSSSGYTNAEQSYVCKATGAVTQTVYGLRNGLYEVKARLTSGTAGNTVFLLGNTSRKACTITTAKAFQEVSMYFLVENHKATIGAIGAVTETDSEGNKTVYYYNKDASGCEYMMDYFSLKYISNIGNGRLYFALDEANAAKENLDSDGQALVNLTSYQSMWDERELGVDDEGIEETEEILQMLATAAKAQRTIGADMTYAIWNHNFERDLEGWDIAEGTYGWGRDAGVKINAGTYATKATDSEGARLLNVWSQGSPTTQTITGLPNGVYKVEVMVSSGNAADDLGHVMVMGNDGQRNGVTPPDGGITFANVGVEFNVTDGTATIGVVGADFDKSTGEYIYVPVGQWWYKADNFRLTLVRPTGELILEEESDKPMPKFEDEYETVTIRRTVSSATDAEGDLLWSAFAVPFDIPADKIAELDWEVKELTGSRVKEDGSVVLNFGDAENIVANKPYLIRTAKGIEEQFVMNNVVVNTNALDDNGHIVQSESGQADSNLDNLQFIGSYVNECLPQYAYFVSGNKFYRTKKAGVTWMKGFRAYFMFTDNPQAQRSIGYRWDDASTGVESESGEETATVVAIYNLNGMRLDGMQNGVNILQMSDGTTMKVIIK